jgi:hypothetical protein
LPCIFGGCDGCGACCSGRLNSALGEQRLDLALDGANLGLWDWNIETGELFVDNRWLKILGYKPGEIAPRSALGQNCCIRKIWSGWKAGSTSIWPGGREIIIPSSDCALRG